MPRKQLVIDSDSLPVMVPRNEKPLAPVAPERVRRLREHLIGILKDLRKAKHLERLAAPLSARADRLRCPRRSLRMFSLQGLVLPKRR
jgi:hypothetical protein